MLGKKKIKGALESAASKAEMDALYREIYFVADRMFQENGTWYVRAGTDPTAPALTITQFDDAFGVLVTMPNISSALAEADTDSELAVLYNAIYFTAARMYRDANGAWRIRTRDDPNAPSLTIKEFDQALPILMNNVSGIMDRINEYALRRWGRELELTDGRDFGLLVFLAARKQRIRLNIY